LYPQSSENHKRKWSVIVTLNSVDPGLLTQRSTLRTSHDVVWRHRIPHLISRRYTTPTEEMRDSHSLRSGVISFPLHTRKIWGHFY